MGVLENILTHGASESQPSLCESYAGVDGLAAAAMSAQARVWGSLRKPVTTDI